MAKKSKKRTGKVGTVSSRKRILQKCKKHYNSKQYESILGLLSNVTIESKDDSLLHQKAKAFYKLGQIDDAMKYIQRAHQINRDKTEYLLDTAQWLEDNTSLLPALTVYSTVVKRNPKDSNSLLKMGLLLERLERFAQAIVCFKKVLEIKPDTGLALRHMGFCYYLLGDLDSAAECYEREVLLGGNTSATWVLIGNLFLSKGQADDAEKSFRKAIEVDDKCYFAYPSFIRATNFSVEEIDTTIEKLELLLKNHASRSVEKRLCHFSLGRLYHKKQDYDTAIVHYEQGNTFRANKVGKFREDVTVTRYKWCRDHLSADFFLRKREFGSDSTKPVFVVGMPRSGTTLLEQIVASHESGFGAGELSTIKSIADEFGFAGSLNDRVVRRLDELTKDQIIPFANNYLERLERHSKIADRIVDKMPQNQVFLWVISLLFPDVPIINCVRDPLDTCLSCFITDFNDGHSYKENLYSVGFYYTVFSKYMDHWKNVISNPILTVQYEELTENTEVITRQVIDHIGLEWDQNCLELRDRGHFSQTASNVQIRKGIYRTPVKRWTKYEHHLGPLKEGMEDGNEAIRRILQQERY